MTLCIGRREFITLLGGAAAGWPLAARAQKEGTPHIGVLLGLADGQPETRSRVKAFQKGLRDLGWVEGRNIRVDYRFAAVILTASGSIRRNWYD
jgi:putative tryptophan/tyrosine transport system substrate-binding protein